MSPRAFTIATILGLSVLGGGCGHHGSEHLFRFEEAYLSEDVLDLMTIVFQASEQAFTGDFVDPADVVDPAGPANGYTVYYELPDAFRLNLGQGSGSVFLQIFEDGLVVQRPLAFDIYASQALDVEIVYDFVYLGETLGGRATDAAFVVTATATRASTAEPFLVEYLVDGDCFLGATYCEIRTRFRAPGRPRDGIEGLFGDAEGFIDDPDIFEIWELDLDYSYNGFRAQGDVGCCGYFERDFWYDDLF